MHLLIAFVMILRIVPIIVGKGIQRQWTIQLQDILYSPYVETLGIVARRTQLDIGIHLGHLANESETVFKFFSTFKAPLCSHTFQLDDKPCSSDPVGYGLFLCPAAKKFATLSSVETTQEFKFFSFQSIPSIISSLQNVSLFISL
jgi:hypothetical protein